MSEHEVTVDWKRETPDFAYDTYNRDHDWVFDAGVTVRASANPAYFYCIRYNLSRFFNGGKMLRERW